MRFIEWLAGPHGGGFILMFMAGALILVIAGGAAMVIG